MKHGSAWTYSKKGCRCGPCTDAKTEASRLGNAVATRGDALPSLPERDERPWTDLALCAQSDPEEWFPAGPGAYAGNAKAVCMRCPVRLECLEWAIANGEIHEGIWGGLAPKQRMALVRQRRRRSA